MYVKSEQFVECASINRVDALKRSVNLNCSFRGPRWCCKCNVRYRVMCCAAIGTGVGVSDALGTMKYFRTCPVRDPGRVRLDLKYVFTFSLLRLSPVSIWGITADIEHASRYGVTSRWSIMNLGIEIGHVVIYARVMDISILKIDDDNVTRPTPCDFSEELISRLGLLELPWDWKSTCVHLLTFLREFTNKKSCFQGYFMLFRYHLRYRYIWFLISNYFRNRYFTVGNK